MEAAHGHAAGISTSSPIKTMWNFIKERLLRIQEEHVPSKMTSTRFSNWVSHGLHWSLANIQEEENELLEDAEDW